MTELEETLNELKIIVNSLRKLGYDTKLIEFAIVGYLYEKMIVKVKE